MNGQLKQNGKQDVKITLGKLSNRSHITSVIIPAYNEEYRIKPFLNELIYAFPASTELIVIFDGNDDTPRIVKSFGDRIKLIQYSKRLGKGRAIIEGFRQATGEVVGFVDADGAIPASEALRLSDMVTEKTPCVIGSRWVRNSRIKISEPFFNKIAGRIFHYFVFLILGIEAKDTQCGVKFFHRVLLDNILNKVTITDRMIDVALLYHVKLSKTSVLEVGIEWKHVNGTRLPIMRAIPLMFATLVGLKLIHSRRFEKDSSVLSQLYSEVKQTNY